MKMASVYLLGLSSENAKRYLEKIKVIGNIDPYSLKPKDLLFPVSELPQVQQFDLYNYLITNHSFCTGKELKAYKGLQAYKFYEAGFVQPLKAAKIDDRFVIVGEVKHSQRMSESNLKVWIILENDSWIDYAHCTCMAGLGEVCSHVAAILFTLHFKPDAESCTDRLALWPVPSIKKTIVPQKVGEIDYGKFGSKKVYADKGLQPLNEQEVIQLLEKVEIEAGVVSALHLVTRPFGLKYSTRINDDPPPLFGGLYSVDNESFPLLVLQNADVSVQIPEDYQAKVQKLTLMQSLSSSWYKYREGLITASNFKRVCCTNVLKPSLSLIKTICYPVKMSFYSKATEYGLRKEKNARKEYLEAAQNGGHQNVKVYTTGLIISTEDSHFAASPDGIVECDCCGSGCIEIKCPYVLKDGNISLESFVELRTSCLVSIDDEIGLNRNHEYYYQIQLQMYVCRLMFCDFVVWCKEWMYIERICYDEEFCKEKLRIALNFHDKVVKPELLARFYTNKCGENIDAVCICNKFQDKSMIQCGNADCLVEWFHLDCVQLNDLPQDSIWFCSMCFSNLSNS